MTVNIFENGEIADADEVMSNFYSDKVVEISTSSSLNTTSGGTTSASIELGDIEPADLFGANYLVINVTHQSGASATYNVSGASSGSVTLSIDTKDLDGAYGTRLNALSVCSLSSGSDNHENQTLGGTVTYIHTLSADEKTNGVKVKLTSSSTSTGTAGSSSFTHIQSVVRLGY